MQSLTCSITCMTTADVTHLLVHSHRSQLFPADEGSPLRLGYDHAANWLSELWGAAAQQHAIAASIFLMSPKVGRYVHIYCSSVILH
jgi:hypothetical protein